MKYLITGGAGFIGSHLADRLVQEGHRVEAFDNLTSGRRANVAHLQGHDAFSLTVANVLDADALEASIAECDRIVHLAAAVGVKRILERPVETIETNVGGTKNVLRLARKYGQKVLLASTSEVYGKAMQKNGLDALSEAADWTLGATEKRRWAYACTKAMDEFLGQAYSEEYGCPVVCVRFFNTSGPRQSGRYGMVIPTFVERALEDRPLEVHGDGTQTRCFTHVHDAVEAVVRLLEAEAAEGEVVNVGRPVPISINELAERVVDLTDSESEVRHVPYDEVYGDGFEDMQCRRPDPSKLRDLIGTVPERPVDEIIHDMIAEANVRQNGHSRAEHGVDVVAE